MSDKCMMCGESEHLQTHHWAYGDDQLEEEWTITICVTCHQIIHPRHGVGHEAGYSILQKDTVKVLTFFRVIREKTTIPTYELAEITKISEPTARKWRRKWGVTKRDLRAMAPDEVDRTIQSLLYQLLEERLQKNLCYTVLRKGKSRGLGKGQNLSIYVNREIYDYLSKLAGKDRTPESEAKKWIEERYDEGRKGKDDTDR